MATLINELSVFLPTYNEEGNIEKVVKNTKKVLINVAGKWEIIIIEDGSSDRTPLITDMIAKKEKGVRVVHHKPNRGYGGALKRGFKESKYEWVSFIDSDGQFDFSEITKFINEQQESKADLVLGIRIQRADPFIRKVFTWGWSVVLPRVLFGLKVTDYSCGFKMIKKEVFNKVQPLIGEEKVTQIEMLVKAQRLGYKFAEVGVHHYPRKFGHQTGADLKVITRSMKDLFNLWLQLR